MKDLFLYLGLMGIIIITLSGVVRANLNGEYDKIQDFEPNVISKDFELDFKIQGIGNNYEYGSEIPEHAGHTVHNIDDIAVAPDGTVYTNAHWEESGTNVSEYRREKNERYN